MAKQGGMGDQLYVDEFNVGGDIGSISTLSTPRTTQDVTPITKSATERLLLLRDGQLSFVSFFNDAETVGAEGAFTVLSTRPTADRIVTYQRGTGYGSPAASMVSKQINYDPTRPQDGSLTFTTDAQANGYGLEWGEQLTPGRLTQTEAGDGDSLDFGDTSTSFGWAAYLHVFAIAGTSVTVTLEDSDDDSDFDALTGGAFTAASEPGAQRIAGASDATVRQYVRISTSGTFTNAVLAVNFVRYLAAVG